MARFDCRGVELVEFKAGDGFLATSTASESELADIDLSDKDWAGYDEQGVSIFIISNFKYRTHQSAYMSLNRKSSGLRQRSDFSILFDTYYATL